MVENKFTLLKEFSRSNFYNNLLEEEYSNLIQNNKFIESYLYINKAYFVESDYEYELGIYLTNNSIKKIFLKEIPFRLKYKEKIIKTFSININKTIESFQGIFLEFKFQKEDLKEEFNLNDIDIEFGKISKVDKLECIDIDFKGLDSIKDHSAYREIKKFIKKLPEIEVDTLDLDVFASGESEDGFFIIILIRNSSSENIKINSIPFELYTKDDLIFYKNYFSSLDKGIEVPAYTGVFKVIFIPKEDIPEILGETLDTIKVKIK